MNPMPHSLSWKTASRPKRSQYANLGGALISPFQGSRVAVSTRRRLGMV